MRKLSLVVVCLVFLTAVLTAQTIYNPTLISFNSPNHSICTGYRVEFWPYGSDLSGTPLASYVVPVAKITVELPGPPPTYDIFMKDVFVFLPFGQTYMARILACTDTACSQPSEVARQYIRYTYCAPNSGTGVTPMTIQQATLATGAVGRYIPLSLTINSLRPVHAVAIQLMGSGQPAYYFTGSDMRGAQSFTMGPLPRAGRYLVNITAADEAGCSTSQATQYLTVR
jgi:hypothetical protein